MRLLASVDFEVWFTHVLGRRFAHRFVPAYAPRSALVGDVHRIHRTETQGFSHSADRFVETRTC